MKCSSCSKKVKARDWWSYTKTCKWCYVKKMYGNNKQLVDKNNSLAANKAKLTNTTIILRAQVRQFRIRLLKIRNEIDYLLEHPYSNDTGYISRKHTKDKNRS